MGGAVLNTESTSPHVLLVVPNGTYRPEPLARAVSSYHPGWTVSATWAGDPGLRPVLDGLEWDDVDDPAWEHHLVTSSPGALEWLRAVPVVRRLLASEASVVVVLMVGSAAVAGPIHAVLPTGGAAASVVPRCLRPLGIDGRHPDDVDLVAEGGCSPCAVAFARGADPFVAWLESQLLAAEGGAVNIGALLDQAAGLFGLQRCDDPAIGAGRWRWDGPRPALLDLDTYCRDEAWVLDRGNPRPARVELVDHPERRALLDDVADQVEGELLPLCAPGGLVIDPVIRAVVAQASTPCAPWSRTEEFRSWLNERYWAALHSARRDLGAAFPDPDGTGAAAFDRWCRTAALVDDVPLLVGVPERTERRLDVAAALRADGLNLVGYLSRESSLGDVARRTLSALTLAQVPVAPIAHQRTKSPDMAVPPPTEHTVRFDTTLAVVNADQFDTLRLDLPALVTATSRMIGYWFWELEHIPRSMRRAVELVDEIWAGSQFVVDAFASVVDVPVRHVPIPVPEPEVSNRQRSWFAPLANSGQRFVFAVVLDHFSVTERKNPVGVIEAFRRAFAPGEGPLLVVKTMNARQRWPQHQHVQLAAEGRDDIVVWDEHLSRSDQMAFLASVDCLVSLHRSEGLGLHLAEAMWLGTPVIATRYSGNLDLMDDDCALLIDASLVPVDGGEGVYPPEAFWADPDLDAAAAAMRRVVGDRALADHLREAGRRRMLAQPSLADTGRHIAELLGIDPSAPAR
jgi:glycosyltransferase involved in cell wall biosynthesis